MSTTALEAAEVRSVVLALVASKLEARGLATADVPDDFDLLQEGLVDSFGLLELIGEVESRFGLEVDFEGIDASDLTAVGPFSRFVAAAGTGSAAAAPEKPSAADPAVVAPEPEARPKRLAAEHGARAPSAPRRSIGTVGVAAYRFAARAWGKLFSLGVGGSFAAFGSHSVIQPPVRLVGERRIAVGSGVYVGAGSWLQVLDGHDEGVAISIGDRASIAGGCVISAVSSIRLGEDVSFARGVYIADHAHAYDDPTRPVTEQGITGIAPVEIDDGAWLGQNVTVLPGVRIGRGAVISASSVVTTDIPDHAVAAGAPARVIRRFGDAV